MSSSSSKFRLGQTGDKMWKRQQLFHATDFQSLMYPNFIFCRILGLFPYGINTSTFETSKLRRILPICLFCAFSIYELIIFHKIVITRTVSYGDVTKTLEVICYYSFGGFIAIVTYILSGPRMRVLQAVLKFSSRLPPESYRKLSRWIHVKDILGTLFLIIQGIIYYSKISDHVVCHALSMYIALLVFQMDMLYMNCICVLKTCFKRINNNLVHLQNIMRNDMLCGPRLICDTQKNQFLLIELKSLKKQHLTVSNTVQMVNVIFSLQLLATIALTFTDVTFEMYSHLMRWQDGLSFILDDQIPDLFFLTSIAYLVLKLILIVWACETGKNQAFKIGTTIHDVLNCTGDKQVKGEVGQKI